MLDKKHYQRIKNAKTGQTRPFLGFTKNINMIAPFSLGCGIQNDLGFEIGPSYDATPTRSQSQCPTGRQSTAVDPSRPTSKQRADRPLSSPGRHCGFVLGGLLKPDVLVPRPCRCGGLSSSCDPYASSSEPCHASCPSHVRLSRPRRWY